MFQVKAIAIGMFLFYSLSGHSESDDTFLWVFLWVRLPKGAGGALFSPWYTTQFLSVSHSFTSNSISGLFIRSSIASKMNTAIFSAVDGVFLKYATS